MCLRVLLQARGLWLEQGDDDVLYIFKGMFRDLAPIQIPLSIIVLIQNAVIFTEYYRDRAKFVSGLFMGIALFDVLKAQGELVLSVTSLSTNVSYFEIDILYKTLALTAIIFLSVDKQLASDGPGKYLLTISRF